MELSNILSSIEDMSTSSIKLSVFKTGKKYRKTPKPPYQTDMFLLKDKINDIQYEVYAVNIDNRYEIIEVMKIFEGKIESSIKNDDVRKDICAEILCLLKVAS